MQDDLGKRLGQRIRQHREAAGLTQHDLADLTLKSVETISNFERGKVLPSLRTLDLVASKLEVPIVGLLDDEPIEKATSDLDAAIASKSQLLGDDDKAFVLDVLQLMVARRRSEGSP